MAEVYGTDFLEVARDKIVALLNALKTTMESGYDPTFSYVYDQHHSIVSLNAVSLGLVEPVIADPYAIGSTGESVLYTMQFEIRVHTAREDGVQDGQKNARLLNSVANKLQKNLNLNDGYRIQTVGDFHEAVDFEESKTKGGSLSVFVIKSVVHAQE